MGSDPVDMIAFESFAPKRSMSEAWKVTPSPLIVTSESVYTSPPYILIGPDMDMDSIILTFCVLVVLPMRKLEMELAKSKSLKVKRFEKDAPWDSITTVPVELAAWANAPTGVWYSKISPVIFRSALLLVTADPDKPANLAPLSLRTTPPLIPVTKMSPEVERMSWFWIETPKFPTPVPVPVICTCPPPRERISLGLL